VTIPRRAGRVLDLAGEADILLVDQFGTLHDGTVAYAGAVGALRALRAAGLRIVLLSNSGKRVARNSVRLTRLGIAPDCYDLSMTSGELGWRLLRQGAIPAASGARRALLLTRDDDPLLDGTGIEPVTDPAAADVVVIAGSEGDRRTLDEYETLLAPAARRGLPAICLNPDRRMLTPGGLAFGTGRIAELYQRLGGEVAWFGKPHGAIYQAVLEAVGASDSSRVAGVGDSVEHDIAGARAVGARGWLVRTGIIADAPDAVIEAECARVGAWPDAVLGAFG
jgi:HAD superfamily hydrolase (TIGR01459 family)